MNSNHITKGEDYVLTNVTTIDKVETRSYPWLYSYFYQRVLDLPSVRFLQQIYKKETPFFMLLVWTMGASMLVTFLLLPERLFLICNRFLQIILGFVAPCLVCFIAYLWTGLILKFYQIKFSVRTCFMSCVCLEVMIEVLGNTGFTNPIKSFVTGVTLSFIIISTGFCVMDKKYLTVSAIVSSIVLLRFIIIEHLLLISYKHTLPPLLAYICIITGLAISTLSGIRIPWFDEDDFVNFKFSNEMPTIPIMRQRRASSVEIPSVNHNGVSHIQKTRRKSLPVLGLPTRKVSMSSMDLTILGEAHGMISDLLADSTLPMNVTGTLRIVADMISPLLQHSFQRNQSIAAPLLTVYEKNIKEDEKQVMNQPDLKDDTPLSLKQRLQRNLGGVSSRRMSSSYTTTTSATGMPTIDMEYHAKKNSANNKVPLKRNSYRSKSYAGLVTSADRAKAFASKSHSFSQPSSSPPSRSPSDCKAEDDIFKVEITRGKPVYFEGMDSDSEEEDSPDLLREDETKRTSETKTSEDTTKQVDGVDNRKLVKKLSSLSEQIEETGHNVTDTCKPTIDVTARRSVNSDTIVTETSTTSETNTYKKMSLLSDKGQPSENIPKTDNATQGSAPLAQRTVNLNIAQVAPVRKSSVDNSGSQESLIIPVNNTKRRSSRELHLEYEVAVSKDVDSLLANINDWDFQIFELSEKCNVLTQLAFRIFQTCGFFKTFKIPEVTFLKYFRALESGYHNIPYHNRIHAADVLHGVHYLTQHKIPGFTPNITSRRSSQDESIPTVTDTELEQYTYGCISNCMPELELMALYTAAAMHDFDHPGRTNAFLVATLNPKALLYNDRSVLENHHAAASWSLLVTNPGLNFLSGLDPVEFKRFRFIVIEEILSTDLKKHFDFLTEWSAKVSGDQCAGLDFSNEADRLLVGQMAIKLADISGPSKEWNLHCRWTDRIIEEFYQQGEDEKSLGMSLSPYMDRNDPKVPQLQASFIKHLVSPLYMAYEKGGIMPGDWIEPDESEGIEEEEEEGSNESTTASDGECSENEKEDTKKKKISYSVVIDNIQKNHAKWLKIIEEEECSMKEDEKDENTDHEHDPSCKNEIDKNESEANT